MFSKYAEKLQNVKFIEPSCDEKSLKAFKVGFDDAISKLLPIALEADAEIFKLSNTLDYMEKELRKNNQVELADICKQKIAEYT